MPKVQITRRSTFSSAHRLYNPNWSDQKNDEVYGKCSRAAGHGHNYTLWVSIEDEIDPKTDMVMNLAELKSIIQKNVLDPLDHRHLSVDVPELKGVNTTAENLAVAIWRMLEPHLPRGCLKEVKLEETENNFAIYRGE